ncbi:MAG: hypothetical protein OXH96_22730 [Spirochaetaceae bacterium]|nr:hypothetical protein [Spirochaetaceae bacterium]
MSYSLNDQLEAVLRADRLRRVASDRVTIRERKANMSIDVTGVKWRATTIRIDRIGDLSGLRRGDWNQKCDYLMVIHKGTTYHATFLELKKSLDEGAPKPLEQLRRSLPFLEYLRSVCCVHFEDVTPPDVDVRYAVIGEKGQQRFDKQSVKARPGQPVWTKPHRGITVSAFLGPTVPLEALVGT